MSQPNYEAEVKKVFDKAHLFVTHSGFKLSIWTGVIGADTRIAYGYDISEATAWEWAYKKLKAQGKII